MACNGHGTEIDSECWCDWGWYQTNCTVSGEVEWGYKAWYSLQTIFTILYSILLITAGFTLYNTLRSDRIDSGYRLAYRIAHSPKNLCLMFLADVGLLRLIWIQSDPFNFNGSLSRGSERFLFIIVYSFIYSIYASILMVWAGLYQGMRSSDFHPIKVLRKAIMLSMILSFPLSISYIVVQSVRLTSNIPNIVLIVCVLASIIVLTLVYLVFGGVLICYIQRKIVQQRIVNSRGASRSNSQKILIERVSVASRNDYSWSENIKSEEESLIVDSRAIFSSTSVQEDKKSECISIVTVEDRSAFTKLTVILGAALILGMMIMVFFSVLIQEDHKKSSSFEYFILCSVLSSEVFACVLIYTVFTTEIKVEEKSYLHFFSRLLRETKHQQARLIKIDYLPKISERLNNYYI